MTERQFNPPPARPPPAPHPPQTPPIRGSKLVHSPPHPQFFFNPVPRSEPRPSLDPNCPPPYPIPPLPTGPRPPATFPSPGAPPACPYRDPPAFVGGAGEKKKKKKGMGKTVRDAFEMVAESLKVENPSTHPILWT